MPRGSAAWIIAIVSALTFVVGAVLLTAVDPVMQAFFSSTIWSASTEDGTNALNWMKAAWAFIGPAILITILLEVWIKTRQPA